MSVASADACVATTEEAAAIYRSCAIAPMKKTLLSFPRRISRRCDGIFRVRRIAASARNFVVGTREWSIADAEPSRCFALARDLSEITNEQRHRLRLAMAVAAPETSQDAKLSPRPIACARKAAGLSRLPP